MIDPHFLTLLIYSFTLLCFDSTIILLYYSLTLLFFDSTIFSLFYSLTLLVFHSVLSFIYRKFFNWFNYCNFFDKIHDYLYFLPLLTCNSFREQWLRFFLTSQGGWSQFVTCHQTKTSPMDRHPRKPQPLRAGLCDQCPRNSSMEILFLWSAVVCSTSNIPLSQQHCGNFCS